MAPVAQDSVEFVELEVSHKIRNITLALYAVDETANELTVLNAIVSAFGASPIVSIPNIVGLEVVENSGRRRLVSESSSIQISYKIQSSTQSADVDSKEAESTLGRLSSTQHHQGEFQQALRDYALEFGATSLAYAITTEDGFSVVMDDDTDDEYFATTKPAGHLHPHRLRAHHAAVSDLRAGSVLPQGQWRRAHESGGPGEAERADLRGEQRGSGDDVGAD